MAKHLLRKRPANVEALGPIHWKAALYDLCFTDNGSYFRRSMTQRTWLLGHWQAIIVGFSGLNR
jgi:hypothetical protein